MMRLKFMAMIAFCLTFSTLFGQFSVTASNGAYTVKVNFSNATVIDKVNKTGPISYTYKIRMDYVTIVTGTPPSNNMYDLRGTVNSAQQSVSFNLPRINTTNSGTVTTSTGTFVGNHDGNIQDVMKSITMVFQWNHIPSQSITIGVNPLPIELINFEAKAAGSKVDLNWITATERDNDYFTIEKTTDGINYESVAKVAGAGNSSTKKEYTYTDMNPSSGISYYRLKQTDYNGVTETFEPKAVEIIRTEIVSNVFPNPAMDSRINVMVAETGSTVEINLYNMVGQLVSTQTVDATSGNTTQMLELPENGNTFIVEIVKNNELLARHKVLVSNR